MLKENFGSSVLISPSTVEQMSVVLAAEPGRGEAGFDSDVMPRGYEITLEREQADAGDDSYFVDAYAVVQWGTGGVRHQATIDWRMGARVFLPAESVRVFAGCVVLAESGAPHSAIRFIASARACDGGSKRGARRTLYAGNLASGATSSWLKIPKFARSFTSYGAGERVGLAGPIEGTTGAVSGSFNDSIRTPIELLSHQRFWAVENLSGDQGHFWGLFDLDL